MQARLIIDGSYRLARLHEGAWVDLAVLAGGARAVLPGGRPVDQAALEAAIEHAEDWLMPHAGELRGADLEVIDAAGDLDAGLQDVFSSDSRQWDSAQLETLFLQLDFMTARPHLAARLEAHRDTVAALVLLRELAHHAKLERVWLRDKLT
ncbi:hypothetical protein [Caenimonas sp. SL110]|uniref:hypothetical protein n=1 Tax=Caenimonas sp. SL110 TaxID=1450524 RepID=UPI0006545BCF|nr:hypothetical protein [Caenimonas sp. SL110]